MTAENLLSRLEGVRDLGAGRWLARCPAHQDRRASLSIREMNDGRVLVHDFAGCDVQDVIEAVGLTLADLFPPRALADHHKPMRRRFDPEQVLRAVAHEVAVVAIAAEDLAAGRPVSTPRLALAAGRLLRGLDALGERPAADELRRVRRGEVAP